MTARRLHSGWYYNQTALSGFYRCKANVDYLPIRLIWVPFGSSHRSLWRSWWQGLLHFSIFVKRDNTRYNFSHYNSGKNTSVTYFNYKYIQPTIVSTPQDTITWCECTCTVITGWKKKNTVLSRIYLYQRVIVAGKDMWGEVLCMYRYVCILSASCPAWVLPIIHVTASKTWHWGFKMVANLECNIIKSWQRRTSFLMLMWKRALLVHADGTWIAC